MPDVMNDYDGNLHQMNRSWHVDGNTWIRVMDLHDQSLAMYEVPQPMKVQTIVW